MCRRQAPARLHRLRRFVPGLSLTELWALEVGVFAGVLKPSPGFESRGAHQKIPVRIATYVWVFGRDTDSPLDL